MVLTSVDGSTWSPSEPAPASDDDCGLAWLAGAPGVVLLGDPDCFTYRGTVD